MKIENSSGLRIEILENGSIGSIEAAPIRISLNAGTLFSDQGTNIFLRIRTNPITYRALTGPGSGSTFHIRDNTFIAQGHWDGLDYECVLGLSGSSLSWLWQVKVKNTSAQPLDLDLVFLQDVGLKPVNAGLINEYYVAQYLERRILQDDKYGSVVCCRQNMKESVGNPWLMVMCGNGALSASTDGMQFYGNSFRGTGVPKALLEKHLDGEYAGESSIVAIQEKPFNLATGEGHVSTFAAFYYHDHPGATSEEDLARIPVAFSSAGTPSLGQGLHPDTSNGSLYDTGGAGKEGLDITERDSIPIQGTPSLFQNTPFLPAEDLEKKELTYYFGAEKRHAEEKDGCLLSFFNENGYHVVTRQKELLVDRPHGHIMQARAGLVPDESICSTTAYAMGVFNSHITQGNTNFNVLLSICRSQFNQDRHTGQRIFVEFKGKRYLLGVPSAFEMGLNHCRWIYKIEDHIFQVRSWTSKESPQINLSFKVLVGNRVNLRITNDFDPLNHWVIHTDPTICESVVKPGPGSMLQSGFPNALFRIFVQGDRSNCAFKGDGELFPDGVSRGQSMLVIHVKETVGFCLGILGESTGPEKKILFEDTDAQFQRDTEDAMHLWKQLSLGLHLEGRQDDISAIREILPWYGMNALTHYLTPYGLEQFGGAAWGTRDVSQGPVELLLTLERYDEARQVLCLIFSNQNPDGGWPQWWMFDSFREIRAQESHGDIFYWCLMALAKYITITGDLDILDTPLPYFQEQETARTGNTPLKEHVERLINMIIGSFIPGTSLVPFGGGDWNDSLQPVSKALAQKLISSWTVEMNYQAFKQYKEVYALTGDKGKVFELDAICSGIKTDFNNYLIKNDIVAGYGLLTDDGSMDVLLHPSDNKTGIHFSLLPMERGILSGIFTPEQADYHLKIIEKHLKGPDGARLMDRPLIYKGGVQEIFQRAESSTFFGREIGLMYIHEHVRYAEALAIMGKADAFVKALRQAIPVAYKDVVPMADCRQGNCYYSSSDVAFKNRYEADEKYSEVIEGKLPLKGGWRVYSSGPGIYIGIILNYLLGIRLQADSLIIDPVLPRSLDNISATLNILGHTIDIIYYVKKRNFSPGSIRLNKRELTFGTIENKYRMGGATIDKETFLNLLDADHNTLEINL